MWRIIALVNKRMRQKWTKDI